jgi:hypothetical protein
MREITRERQLLAEQQVSAGLREALKDAATNGDCPRCQYGIGELLKEQKLRAAAEASLADQLNAANAACEEGREIVAELRAELATLKAQEAPEKG